MLVPYPPEACLLTIEAAEHRENNSGNTKRILVFIFSVLLEKIGIQ
jgi:hypothetical protein